MSRPRRKPTPRTRDTQISFLGVPAAQIHAVSVMGTRSGRHAGHLDGYSQGDGASFVPDSPFDAGERVTRACCDRRGRAAAGRSPFSSASTRRIRRQLPPGSRNPPAAPADYQSFYTLPGVQAPILSVTVPDRDPAAGDILTTNGPGPGQYGPLIYTPQGRLVWFDKLSGGEAAEDLNEQTYDRPARPDLVEGQGALARLRPGRRHRHELQLSDGREDSRRQRPEGRPARLPDRPARRRLHHGVQPDPLQPHRR